MNAAGENRRAIGKPVVALHARNLGAGIGAVSPDDLQAAAQYRGGTGGPPVMNDEPFVAIHNMAARRAAGLHRSGVVVILIRILIV